MNPNNIASASWGDQTFGQGDGLKGVICRKWLILMEVIMRQGKIFLFIAVVVLVAIVFARVIDGN